MLRVTFKKKDDGRLLARLQLLVDDGSFDKPVEIAAWRCYRDLVLLTPKGWTGLTRRSWQVSNPQPGQRLVFNNSKAMLFMDQGTGNAGTPTSNGGYIYPSKALALFIPLNARAATSGWEEGMKYGTDYVLARRVKGIKAMMIVQKYRPKARQHLKDEMKTFLQQALK